MVATEPELGSESDYKVDFQGIRSVRGTRVVLSILFPS